MSDEAQVKGELVELAPVQGFLNANLLPFNQTALIEKPQVFTTLPAITPENKANIYDAMIDVADKSDLWINREFEIADILIYPVEKTNEETGEIFQLPRMVFITTTGNRIEFYGKGIWDSVQMMKTCQFQPFGPTPQKWVLRQVKTKNERSMQKLFRVPMDKESTPVNATKSKK